MFDPGPRIARLSHPAVIRPVQSSDRSGLSHMGHSEAEIDRMTSGRARTLITLVWQEADGTLLGSASAGPGAGPPGLWISGLVRVAPVALGRGIGTAVVRAAVADARARGATQIQCYIEPGNAASIRAHERAGYLRAPAERSFLVRAGTIQAQSTEPPVNVEEGDSQTLGKAVTAIGFAEVVRYFPELSSVVAEPPRQSLRELARRALRSVRGTPAERCFVLSGTDQATVGLILAIPGGPVLLMERAQVSQLTLSRLATAEQVVAKSYWPRDPKRGFLLLHDDQMTPDPKLVRKTQRIYVA
jgi:GNAT superfamily N-acetyltransferase